VHRRGEVFAGSGDSGVGHALHSEMGKEVEEKVRTNLRHGGEVGERKELAPLEGTQGPEKDFSPI